MSEDNPLPDEEVVFGDSEPDDAVDDEDAEREADE